MHFGWATGSSSTSSHGLRGVRKKLRKVPPNQNKSLHQRRNSPSMRLTGSSGSKRTENTWRPLDWTFPNAISDRPNTPKKYSQQRPKRRKVVATVPRKGWRVSRRLRGRKAITKVGADRRNAIQMAKRYEEQRQKSEKDMYQTLLRRYQRDTKWSSGSKKSSRNLFLVPTGTLGYNDHTLERKVPQLGSYLWGFASGT